MDTVGNADDLSISIDEKGKADWYLNGLALDRLTESDLIMRERHLFFRIHFRLFDPFEISVFSNHEYIDSPLWEPFVISNVVGDIILYSVGDFVRLMNLRFGSYFGYNVVPDWMMKRIYDFLGLEFVERPLPLVNGIQSERFKNNILRIHDLPHKVHTYYEALPSTAFQTKLVSGVNNMLGFYTKGYFKIGVFVGEYEDAFVFEFNGCSTTKNYGFRTLVSMFYTVNNVFYTVNKIILHK